MIEKITNYLKESYVEFKKVRWLTSKETFRLTLNIILFIIIFSIFYGIVDFIFAHLIIALK